MMTSDFSEDHLAGYITGSMIFPQIVCLIIYLIIVISSEVLRCKEGEEKIDI